MLKEYRDRASAVDEAPTASARVNSAVKSNFRVLIILLHPFVVGVFDRPILNLLSILHKLRTRFF